MKRAIWAVAALFALACSDSTGPRIDGEEITAIAAGTAHSCALASSGNAYCWGDNSRGALGTKTQGPENRLPTLLVMHPLRLGAIAAGGTRSCALLVTGDPFCTSPIIGPLHPLANSVTLTALSVGSQICGLASDGSAHCWSEIDATSAAPAGAPAFQEIRVGAQACGVTAEGAVYCWGAGETPTRVDAPVALGHLSMGPAHACAVGSDAAVYCWGSNDRGQLGTLSPTSAVVRVALPAPAADVTAGGAHTCALTTGGAAYCWGSASSGQLGWGGTAPTYGDIWTAPMPVAGGHTWRQLAAGGQHTCGLATDGLVYCWGANTEGQIGDGSTTLRSTPVKVGGDL